ncbi:MAG: DUF2304 domain-containing protein [Chloroflexota bacterium]
MNAFLSIRLAALTGAITIFVYTLYLIRSNRLSAHLAVSWVMVEILLIIIISVPAITANLLAFLGENNFYAIAFLFIIGWIALLMLDTLIRVSDLVNKTRVLIQENGLLREQIERLEKTVSNLADQSLVNQPEKEKNTLGKR